MGEFTVPVELHKDVTAKLKVVIKKEATMEYPLSFSGRPYTSR